jgi:prepilin-type N-terminal cleavage/methylation domain-containing protein
MIHRRRPAFRNIGAASRAARARCHTEKSPPRLGGPTRRGFTLFELILAIALSAVLLALIGMAINLYLTRVATSRDRVEEAQLARSILAMIADDLRATAIYHSQDVSGVAQLMAESAAFDVDSIDAARSGSTTAPGGTSGAGGVGTSGGATTTGSTLGSLGASGAGASSGDSSAASAGADISMPLGVNGGIEELYVDIGRLPRGDELFGTLTGYSNAPMVVQNDGPQAGAGGQTWGARPSPSDLKSIRYFIREGDRADATGLAATALGHESQAFAGGLVRQEIPRPARMFAEQNANSAVLESGQVLIAPEVIHIEFRYFDGEQVLEMWDMAETRSLPRAVEVRIWLTSSGEAMADGAVADAETLLSTSREYRQTVFLPMAELSQTAAASGASGASAGASSTGSSTSGTSSAGTSSGSSSFGSGSN